LRRAEKGCNFATENGNNHAQRYENAHDSEKETEN